MRINFLFVLLGGLIGLISGFVLANNSHRNQIVGASAIVKQNSLLPIAPTPTSQIAALESNRLNASPEKLSEENLSEAELAQVVSQADQNPNDQPLQRNLGLALYRYAVINQKTDVLQTSIRLLKRSVSPTAQTDFELLTNLAAALLAAAQQTSDPDKLNEARRWYSKAIKLKPADANLRVGLSYTYYLSQPPDFKNTFKNLETALKIDSKNEAALAAYIKILIESKRLEDASRYLSELQQINPTNQSIANLKILIAQRSID